MADSTCTEMDTYFTLRVDGFATSDVPGLTGDTMSSYLRIGAVPNVDEPGDELTLRAALWPSLAAAMFMG